MIKKLDSFTIDKIAAGEVIDRPASIVKELVENAIDSHASFIEVSIKQGGKEEIIVKDNGCGIKSDELPLSVKRHATSKISSFEDIENVLSLGFRGEALASISAVSKLEIISKQKDEDAWRYEIHGDKEIAFEKSAGVDGTKVVVKEIFFNVPARKKFLKTDLTEGSYITKKMQSLALSHPEISFTYKIDAKEKFRTSGSKDTKKLVFEIFGREISESGKEIDIQEKNIKIKGYLGSPSIGRGNRNNEITFVNGRIIENSALFHAIEEGYRGFLMEHKYPFVLLYIDVNPIEIDVNVHPSKNDIKFSNPQILHQVISNALRKKLGSDELVHKISLLTNTNICSNKKDIDIVNYDCTSVPLSYMEEMKARVEKKYKENFGYNFKDEFDKPNSKNIHEKVIEEAEKKEDDKKEINLGIFDENINKKDIKVIGQIFNTYWIIEYDNEMLIIDQHAAHEKVLYEKFLNQYNSSNVTSQILLSPILINIPVEEKNFQENFEDIFKSYGFEIQSMGDNDYLIRSIPSNLLDLSSKEKLTDFIDELFENYNSDITVSKIKDKIAMTACKAAVKGNQSLSFIEIKHLIEEMMSLDNPYHCPHGRPTMIKMTKKEIEKHFGRIV